MVRIYLFYVVTEILAAFTFRREAKAGEGVC